MLSPQSGLRVKRSLLYPQSAEYREVTALVLSFTGEDCPQDAKHDKRNPEGLVFIVLITLWLHSHLKKVVNMVHMFSGSCAFMQILSNVAFILVDEVKQLERLELRTDSDIVGDPEENVEQVLSVIGVHCVSATRKIIKF